MEEFNKEEYLEKLHTKQLLKLRDKIYKVRPDNHTKISSDDNTTDNQHGRYDVSDSFKNHYVSIQDVKKELSTREHVPNAQEAKEIRQQRAKMKR